MILIGHSKGLVEAAPKKVPSISAGAPSCGSLSSFFCQLWSSFSTSLTSTTRVAIKTQRWATLSRPTADPFERAQAGISSSWHLSSLLLCSWNLWHRWGRSLPPQASIPNSDAGGGTRIVLWFSIGTLYSRVYFLKIPLGHWVQQPNKHDGATRKEFQHHFNPNQDTGSQQSQQDLNIINFIYTLYIYIYYIIYYIYIYIYIILNYNCPTVKNWRGATGNLTVWQPAWQPPLRRPSVAVPLRPFCGNLRQPAGTQLQRLRWLLI